MVPEIETTKEVGKNDRQTDEYAWLSSGSPLPWPRLKPLNSSNDIVTRLLNRYLWLLIVLGIVSTVLLGYVSFQKGQMDALRDRQQGISRY